MVWLPVRDPASCKRPLGQHVCISAASGSFDCSYHAPLHAINQDAGVRLHTVALRQAPLKPLARHVPRTMHLYLNMYVMTLHPGCSSACNFWSSLDMPFGSRYKKTAVAVERSLSKAFPQMIVTLSCKCSAAYQTCPYCMHNFVLNRHRNFTCPWWQYAEPLQLLWDLFQLQHPSGLPA